MFAVLGPAAGVPGGGQQTASLEPIPFCLRAISPLNVVAWGMDFQYWK
jgi:hypothetical protein